MISVFVVVAGIVGILAATSAISDKVQSVRQ